MITTWFAIISQKYLVFAFHLAGIFIQYDQLQKVLHSVQRPFVLLLLTFVLFLIITYWFAVIGYILAADSYPNDMCSSLAKCWFTTFDAGFKNDGGVGGYLKDISTIDFLSLDYVERFIFDHMFNLILMVLLLNIVFGLVIDTFSEMRSENDKILDDMQLRCTMCDIPASRFESAGESFRAHISFDHNIWDYYYMFAYLHRKNELEFTGVESYLHNRINDQHLALSVFPTQRALVLKDHISTIENDDGDAGDGFNPGTSLRLQKEIDLLSQKMNLILEHLIAEKSSPLDDGLDLVQDPSTGSVLGSPPSNISNLST